MGNEFQVTSGHGYLIVNAMTGTVRKCVSDGEKDDYLPKIDRFDIARFKERFKTPFMPESVDILRLGFWDEKNVYDTPAEGYEPDWEIVTNKRLDELYQYLLTNIDSIPGANVYDKMDHLFDNDKITQVERVTWGVDFQRKDVPMATKLLLQKIIDEMY